MGNANREIEDVRLNGLPLFCNSMSLGANFVAKSGEYIIVQSKYENPVFTVYALNKDTLIEHGAFLRTGEGPFEMIYPNAFYDSKINKFFVYDFAGGLKSMYSIDVSKITNLYDTSTWERVALPEIKSYYFGLSMFLMDDHGFLILGSHFNSKNLYSYVKCYELNYSYPLNDGTFNMEPIVKQSVYMDAVIVKHPFLDKFVYACGTGMYADIINYADTLLVNRISLFNIYPEYTTKDGVNRSYKNECLRGMQVRVTKDAIYIQKFPLTKEDVRNRVMYKGYPNYYNDELFVFDWEGNLIRKYVLDTPIYSYVIDEENNKLYGMTVDLENDEPLVMSYTMM